MTDTVGFIRDLPQELVRTFRATLEGLREADLLLHVVDATAWDIDVQITTVTDILRGLNLDEIPRKLVFNKGDLLPPPHLEQLCRRYDAIGISALRPETLHPLVNVIDQYISTRVMEGQTFPVTDPFLEESELVSS